MKQKKFTGVYEYYRSSDPDKAVTAYYISVRDHNNQPKKIKTDATTPEEAVTALAHFKATREHSPVISNNKMTFSNIANKFFDQRTTTDNSGDIRRYELHIKPILGNTLLSKVAKRSIVKLQKHLQLKQVPVSTKEDAALKSLSPKSINIITDLAMRIMHWAFDQELIRVPLPNIEKLRVDNERQRIFTKEELDLIFNTAEGDTLIFLRLMYHTGQRPKSILQLQKKHIINGSILIESIKHQSSHMVPISSKLDEVLAPWIEYIDSDDYIVSKNKNPLIYDTLAKRIKRLFGTLFNQGLNFQTDAKTWASMYTLRHTALTNIYQNSGDIYAAQSIANHSSITMTQRYAKQSYKLKRHAVEGL